MRYRIFYYLAPGGRWRWEARRTDRDNILTDARGGRRFAVVLNEITRAIRFSIDDDEDELELRAPAFHPYLVQ